MSVFDTVGTRPSCKYSHLFDSSLNNFWAVEALRSICERYNNNTGSQNTSNKFEANRVPRIVDRPATERPMRGYCVGRIDFSPVKKSTATPHFSAVNGVPRWSKEYKTKKLFLKTLQKHFGGDSRSCKKTSNFLDSLKIEQKCVRVDNDAITDDLSRLVAFVNKSDIILNRKIGLYDHILIDLPDIKPTWSKNCSKNDQETHSKKDQSTIEHTISCSSSNEPHLSSSASSQSLLDIIDISLIDNGNKIDSPQRFSSPNPNPVEWRKNEAAIKHYFSFFEENCIKVEDIHRLLDFNCDEFAYRPNFLSLG